MKNLTVGKKIFAGFAVVVGMMLIMGVSIIVTTLMSNSSISNVEGSTALKNAIENSLTSFEAAQVQANIIYNMTNQEANEAFVSRDKEVRRQIEEALSLSSSENSLSKYTKDIQSFKDSYGTWSNNVQAVIQINDELTELGNQAFAATDSIYAALISNLESRIGGQTSAANMNSLLGVLDDFAIIRQGVAHIRDTFDGTDAANIQDRISEACATFEKFIAEGSDVAPRENLEKALESCNAVNGLIDGFIEKNEGGWNLVDATTELGSTNESMLLQLSTSMGSAMVDDIGTSNNVGQLTMWITCAVLIISLAVSILMGVSISRNITIPTKGLSFSLKYLADTGNLQLPEDVQKLAQQVAARKDELGQTANSYGALMQRLSYIAEELEKVAEGDLSSKIKLASDNDVMGLSLQKMNIKLNEMFNQINTSTSEVSSGARQVANGAQTLAHGATEQAASVEELSGAIASVAAQTHENAKRAADAAQLAESIMKDAEVGSRQMRQMMLAVEEINKSSNEISKVIKVIDDIAFQTNILALNAAVEAARAGQHGKGFAVVAEEVRSLASKSAEAARNTGEMITNSMEKAELGARIADENTKSLDGIVKGINQSSLIVNEIANTLKGQSSAISEINTGIERVTDVVQQNAATAEQSAAASQQMSSQSDVLESLVAQFRLRDDHEFSASDERSFLPSSDFDKRW